MEASERKRKARQRRRKRKDIRLASKKVCESFSQNLGVIKKVGMKCTRPKVKISKQCLSTFIEGFCQQQIPSDFNQDDDLRLCRESKNDPEKTIDLCDGDSSIDNVHSGDNDGSISERNYQADIVIDLSKDHLKSGEVIDLTETSNMIQSDCQLGKSLQPIVVDITEDETNCKPENDEVFVIGTFSRTANLKVKCKSSSTFIPLSSQWNNPKSLITCSEKLKKKYLKRRSVLNKIDGNSTNANSKINYVKIKKGLQNVGENVYVNSPSCLPSTGLRPIIIDGSNVAFVHSHHNFCCKRLEICINYFKEKGHKVTAFVPQFRVNSNRSDDPQLLRKLERQGDVVLTPSKKIDGINIVPYDDRFIVQTAVLKGGIIVTRDNYNDLLKENPEWAETIKYRTLAFTWVDDVLMFPKDPLGEFGPSLEEFLRFH